ncbi:MAG: transporter [Proteobacteria bacterium]|nr:transporter [Pseudomonadota bacterium]
MPHKTLNILSNKATRLSFLLLFLLLALLPGNALAQGEGPRVYMPAPVGTNALSLTWMDMKSNMNFAGNILIPGAKIQSDILALNYNRWFAIGGRLAEIWITGIVGNVDGAAKTSPFGALSADVSGIADPYFALRVGLIGAPAMDLATFMKTPQKFQMFALAGISPAFGDYKQSRPLNLGTNRWALRLGLPMTMPLGSKPGTWLEINPNMYIYGDNDEPYQANRRSQDNLYVLESHLSHNFTPKFWMSIDLRYQNGGETKTDGVYDDNSVNRLGGGISAGYSFNRAWSGFFGYGDVISETDNSKLNMWRARLIYAF